MSIDKLFRTIAVFLVASLLLAQTVVNGGRIQKGLWDASTSVRTNNNRQGTGSPVGRDACTKVGESYFQTDATAGSNIFYCTTIGTPGIWTLNIGTAYTPGNGMALTGTVFSSDTAVMLSQATGQAGTPWQVDDTASSGTTYTGTIVPAISAYPSINGFCMLFTPATKATGGATTLNLNAKGAKPVYAADGVSNPWSGALQPNVPVRLCYSPALNSAAGAFVMDNPASQGPVASVFGSGTITIPAGNSVLVGCSSTCAVPVPVPTPGYQICIKNNAGVTTVITLSGLGGGAMYPKADDSGYGTAGSGTMVGSAATNKVCLIGRDSTHYELGAVNVAANWTVN
jgi:hypothetical protein